MARDKGRGKGFLSLESWSNEEKLYLGIKMFESGIASCPDTSLFFQINIFG